MAEYKNKWLDAVLKMIKFTQEDKLQWESKAPPNWLNKDPEVIVDVIFMTIFKNKAIQLYEKRTKIPNPGNLPFIKGSYYWKDEIVLEFIDEEGCSLWRFPQSSALNDLLNAVKYQVAGVTDFLDEILEEQ